MIELKDLENRYLKGAVALAVNEYEQELRSCRLLIQDDFRDKISHTIEVLFQKPQFWTIL